MTELTGAYFRWSLVKLPLDLIIKKSDKTPTKQVKENFEI